MLGLPVTLQDKTQKRVCFKLLNFLTINERKWFKNRKENSQFDLFHLINWSFDPFSIFGLF